MKSSLRTLVADGWHDYELLDSGGGAKLERFGAYRLARPEPAATWRPALPAHEWAAADAVFEPGHDARDPGRGRWRVRRPLPERWSVAYGDLRCWVQPTPYRHVGLFPEQAPQWDWLRARVAEGVAAGQQPNVLNLFAYTGLATLAAAAAGARVTHVDASRKTVAWARENQALAGLADRPVRWIVDDALKFAQREVRRGARYDALILDPPPFGRGPGGEIWRLEDSLPQLLAACRMVLSEPPRFAIVTVYATESSPEWLRARLDDLLYGHAGRLTLGQAALRESGAGRVLPLATFARWHAART